MLDWMARAPQLALPENEVVHLNMIISKDRRRRTLAAMIEELRAFSFPAARAALARAGKPDYFGV
jgi:hypothetical protein